MSNVAGYSGGGSGGGPPGPMPPPPPGATAPSWRPQLGQKAASSGTCAPQFGQNAMTPSSGRSWHLRYQPGWAEPPPLRASPTVAAVLQLEDPGLRERLAL